MGGNLHSLKGVGGWANPETLKGVGGWVERSGWVGKP